LEVAREIDRVCDEFAAEIRAGKEPRIEHFRGRVAESGRGALLGELIVTELEYLGDEGRPTEPDAYYARFPNDQAVVDAAFGRLKVLADVPRESGALNERPVTDRGVASTASHNLLFGIIALQNDFVSREALVAGFDAWVHDKSRTLAEILQSQGALSADDREVLDRLIVRFLERHGGDAEKSLAVLSSVPHVRPELEQLDDADLSGSLGHVGEASSADSRFTATALFTQERPRGRFRILRPHAKGGLGQVSVALDQDLNREVALKEIQPKHADNAAARERFLLEAEITGALEHPGIVPVYALGQGPDGRPFYAMRFVKGDSLKQAIEDFHKPDNPNRKDPGARQLELRQLLGRFIDVCNAMEYAHSRGVLHRDLKPGNIMVGKYGETLVVDWGLAKSVGKKEIVSDEGTLRPSSALSSSGQTQPGSAVGTPAYMSPEQAAGKLGELGPASDVYSLGASLYHVLCGKPPFEGKEPVEIAEKVNRGDFAKPRQISSTIPPSLEAICLKAMALQPAERYPTARALADDLEHWLADEPVTAMPDRLGDRLRRFGRRHRGAVRAAGVAVIVLAVVSTVAAVLVNESRKKSVELAGTNERLAHEKSALANSERKAKIQAQQLADENGLLARNERDARQATERQLRIAMAERLAALSQAKQFESPEISLALAVESGRATSTNNLGVRATSHQALLDSLSAIGGCPLVGHNDRITGMAISPDGHWIVSTGYDNTIRIWDLKAENPAASPRAFQGSELGESMAVAIAPDSRSIVAANYGVLRIWDLSADSIPENPRVLRGQPGLCFCIAVSSDSQLVVMGSGNEALVWNLAADGPAAGPRILAGHQDTVMNVAISPNGRWIVTGSSDATNRLWDLAADDPGASRRISDGPIATAPKAAFSPSGRWVVTASEDNAARVWDLTANDPVDSPIILRGHEANVTSLAISPDGHWIVTGSWDRTARVWDLQSDDPAANSRVLSGHSGPVRCLSISPDSRTIVTGSADKTARVWNLSAENPAAHPRVLTAHQGEINTVAISPDSRWVVTGADDNTPRIWDLQEDRFVTTPRVLRVDKPHISSVAISPDSRWIVTGSEQGAKVWDLNYQHWADREQILPGYHGTVWNVAISPDSRWVVAGCEDNATRIWALSAADRDPNPRLLKGHTARVFCVAISPDGRWILTGSGDNTARVWDLTAEDPAANPRELTGHADPVKHALFSPDGRWGVTIGIGAAAEARVWDLRTADPVAIPLVIPAKTSCAAFTPDSRWLVSGGTDNKVRIWDLTALDPLSNPRILTGHEYGIAALAVSSDGRWLVTGGLDRTARVWDLAADDPSANVQVLSGHQGSVTSVAISPDGGWIASGGFDQSLRLWEATPANRSFTSRVLRGHESAIAGVLLSPDSRRIVTWSYDLTARCWIWQWDDLVEMASKVGRNLGREEWRQIFPDEPYRTTFPDRPIPGDPQTAVDYLIRGTKRRWLNELDGAIDDFIAAIGLDQNFRDAYIQRAEIRALQGQVGEALRDYSEAIRLDPTRAAAFNSRAWLLATANDGQSRDGQQAIADATQACELTNWNDWRFLDTLAAAYGESGDFDNAVKWQTQSLATTPDDQKAEVNMRLELYKSSKPYRVKP
jgi:WD40 repeat protein/serine/threonine protein kinase